MKRHELKGLLVLRKQLGGWGSAICGLAGEMVTGME